MANGPTSTFDLHEIAAAMRDLTERVGGDDGSPLEVLVHHAVEAVPGTRWASVSMLRRGHFATPASTDPVVTRADDLQYELGAGPCVDSVLERSLFVTGDVASDRRWPEWGSLVASELGVRSVLAQRLALHEVDGAIAGLNLYSDHPAAFDDRAVGVGLVLATHAAAVVSESLAATRATNLLRALESSREIGIAIGVLMYKERMTRAQAFDVLRVASQNTNRKLTDVAAEVARTGALAIDRQPPARHPSAQTARDATP